MFRLVNRLSGRPGDDPIERAIAAENPLPLIVEHSLIFSDGSAAMLTSLEYKFDLAKHGEEAIIFYERYLKIVRPYDAVVIDPTIIGGMDGETCFRELKKLDPEVRAIVSSSYDNDEMVQRYLDLGFCGYLTKPYRVADLGARSRPRLADARGHSLTPAR